MSMLDILLGDRDQERTVTVKSKPQKESKESLPKDLMGPMIPRMRLGNPPMKGFYRGDGSGALAESHEPYAVSVPIDRQFGFIPEGPTPLDAAIHKPPYEFKASALPEIFGEIMKFMFWTAPNEVIDAFSDVKTPATRNSEYWNKRNRKGH